MIEHEKHFLTPGAAPAPARCRHTQNLLHLPPQECAVVTTMRDDQYSMGSISKYLFRSASPISRAIKHTASTGIHEEKRNMVSYISL